MKSDFPGDVLYLDVDGVLQYAQDNHWTPRQEADDFLKWAVQHFRCRWLTSWVQPNETIPKELGIVVPGGIEEVQWRVAGPNYPFKAAAIRDDENWFWLEDEPSEFDLEDLKRRRMLSRLILVDRHKPYVLMGQIRQALEKKLQSGG